MFVIAITNVGSDFSNIAIIPSEIPLISKYILPNAESFLISAFDPTGTLIRASLQVQLSKLLLFLFALIKNVVIVLGILIALHGTFDIQLHPQDHSSFSVLHTDSRGLYMWGIMPRDIVRSPIGLHTYLHAWQVADVTLD